VAPIVASLLIGVGVKVAVGLGATAVKKLMEPAAATPAAKDFSSLLEGERPGASALPRGVDAPAAATSAPVRLPHDLPGRLTAERLYGLALDAEGARSVPGPGFGAPYRPEDPLAAYRRVPQAT
jgi:hypothetical protein